MTTHPFRPTLTLAHHESGWDGTFGAMLHEMAGILDDGPLDARITYWHETLHGNVTVTGQWDHYEDWAFIGFAGPEGALIIATDDIVELSI